MKSRNTLFLSILALCACTLNQDSDAAFGADTEASEEAESSTTQRDEDRPEPSPRSGVADVCERIDECGFLPPGVRRTDCEDTTQMCLEGGLQSERSDWELFAEECLELENCFNFLDCYEGLQTCDLPLDVETTGGLVETETSGGLWGTTSGGFGGSTSSFPEPGETTGEPPDPSGDGGGGGDASGGGDGDGGDGGGGNVDPPTCGGSCEACIDCAFEGPCAIEATGCALNESCVDLNDCYADCFDADCYDLCDDLFPGGVGDYGALTVCIFNECEAC